MRKKFEWCWEQLDQCTFRAKVIGGWLFRCTSLIEGKQPAVSESVVFVHDPNHEMIILPKQEPEQPVIPAQFKESKL